MYSISSLLVHNNACRIFADIVVEGDKARQSEEQIGDLECSAKGCEEER